MGLLQDELKEITEQRKRHLAGKLKSEDAMIQLGYFSQSEKRVKHMLTALSTGAKHGKVLMNQILRTNIISDSAIDCRTIDDEEDTIKCEQTNETLTRQECLDKSGEPDSCCNGCETGLINKRILCGTDKA